MAVFPGTTLADHIVPARQSRIRNLLCDALLITGLSVFTALCAHVSFVLPFTPVPITLQTLAILLTGATLGSRRGGLALLLYLAEGVAGLPVFAPIPGSLSGFAVLLSVTGGYLWAFPLAAFTVGWLCERGWDRSLFTSALAMLPGSVIIYLLGAIQLGILLRLNALQALQLGVFPFLPGDLFKLLIAALLLPASWRLVRATKR